MIHTELPKIKSVSFQLAGKEHAHIPAYDNTKLVAMNTCPAWGTVRYGLHKRMPGSGRSMPLEAGHAMHEVFAWVRWCTLMRQGFETHEHAISLCDYHGFRLFGEDRYKEIMNRAPLDATAPDWIQWCKQGALIVLETGAFYDDPSDRRRTLSNLEECALAYIDRWDWTSPVWIRDLDDPQSDVGIEINYNLLVTIEFENGYIQITRHTGIVDGIHVPKGVVTLGENKTASRLNDAWSMSFALATQVTGYCIAASTFTETDVRHAIIHGLSIPLPRNYDFGGIVREYVTRRDYHFTRWIEWYARTVAEYETYVNAPLTAPMFTHSCNRYFQPCSFIPLCDNTDEERQRVLSEMVKDVWSPLATKVGD